MITGSLVAYYTRKDKIQHFCVSAPLDLGRLRKDGSAGDSFVGVSVRPTFKSILGVLVLSYVVRSRSLAASRTNGPYWNS